ncbi:hypothetical protein AK812_SmicGene4463 [Symbiodinium microadriaticum]|uniref:Uncharacterized protein n=1 Tax=Symbiodinium microadriaticum TaxID=2951 RepID=A0A1Q9EW54_SYMMI|nr:hypothetical protein AK812_SmicGene4463 [Symbiodinium microadriaticum]
MSRLGTSVALLVLITLAGARARSSRMMPALLALESLKMYARGSIALMAAMELQTATFSYEPVPGSSGHGGYPHLGSDQDEEIMIAALRAQTVTGVTPEKVQEFNSPVGSGPWNPDGGYSITPGDIMNSSPGSGLDMHRRLHNRLDPTDMVTSFRWLRAFMSTETVPDVGGLDPGY